MGDVPEIRRRLPKLKSNFCRAYNTAPPRIYDPALLLFTAYGMLEKHAFVRRYFVLQINQCAVSTDHQRIGLFRKVGLFRKGLTRTLRLISANRHSQDETLTASFVFPAPGWTRHRWLSIPVSVRVEPVKPHVILVEVL